jgi:hypothetical protein
MKRPKISVFSVHKDAMAASARAFERDWPEAQIDNLLDDGLFRWIGETKEVVEGMYKPFDSHTFCFGRD